MNRRRVLFQGRVQGVGFRERARDTAARHPVTGWVRNEPDGTVLLEVQGEEAAVERYLADLRRRVSGLVVRELTVQINPDQDESGFVVRYA